jgi:phospholipase/carboxylesterase
MTPLVIDPEAVIWSAPESERTSRPLLVLLHGYGSYEGDLFGLSPHLPLEPVIASVRAPISEMGGFAWFPRGVSGNSDERIALANEAAVAVLGWLDGLGLDKSTQIGLLGFSQGGAMALQLLRHAPERFAYAVQLSGFVIEGGHPGDAALTEIMPPVLWGRGTADPVIPEEFIALTQEWLPEHSSLETRTYEGLAHGISGPELGDISAFISRFVGVGGTGGTSGTDAGEGGGSAGAAS